MRSRTVRWLVLAGLVCTISLVARKVVGQSSTPWPPDASEQKLYMIGNAHIDIPWLWPWSEAMGVGLSTFRAALDRMNEFPDFKFTASSAQLYEWAAAADPNMIAEIRKRVAELCGIPSDCVGIKAKTPEGMGTENAAIANAAVLLKRS